METSNVMAMRHALEEALAYCESDQKSGIAYSDNDVLVPMLRAALAEPARNCDRFDTWSEAWDAFAAAYFGPTDPGELEYHFGVWLFEPEKGGAQ